LLIVESRLPGEAEGIEENLAASRNLRNFLSASTNNPYTFGWLVEGAPTGLLSRVSSLALRPCLSGIAHLAAHATGCSLAKWVASSNPNELTKDDLVRITSDD
jgi:hypothetical protein